ncbi:MAG: hypothetical protein LBT05_00450 [Planctomycetaceae bacterium]|jgi:hypothetical protein|nr:hypothetical protein [Planctomycetaceae bacterium]
MSGGMRKAAIFLSGLDWKTTDVLLKRLPEEEARAVRQEMITVRRISREEIHTAARQFLLETKTVGGVPRSQTPDNSQKTIISGADADVVEFSSNVSASITASAYRVHDSFDSTSVRLENITEQEPKREDRFDAENLTQQNLIQQEESRETESETPPKRFEELERMTPFDAAVFLAAESEQLIAVVLSQLTPQCSRDVLACFERSLKRDVIRRLAKLGETDEMILDEIDFVLKSRLTQEFEEKNKFKPGLALLEQILQTAENESANGVDDGVCNDILLGLNEIEEEERGGYQETDEPEYQNDRDDSIYGEETYDAPLIAFERLALLDDFDLAVLFRGQNSDLTLCALSACDPIFADRVISQFPVYEQITLREMMRQTFSSSPEEQMYSQECILQGALQLIREGIIADVTGAIPPTQFVDPFSQTIDYAA